MDILYFIRKLYFDYKMQIYSLFQTKTLKKQKKMLDSFHQIPNIITYSFI